MENLVSGEKNAEIIGKESHRLLHLMDTAVGVTLPSGGTLVDDVYGHYPKLVGAHWSRVLLDQLSPGTGKKDLESRGRTDEAAGLAASSAIPSGYKTMSEQVTNGKKHAFGWKPAWSISRSAISVSIVPSC